MEQEEQKSLLSFDQVVVLDNASIYKLVAVLAVATIFVGLLLRMILKK